MFVLKNKYVMSIERAKKFALTQSDSRSYVLENGAKRLSLVLRSHRITIDFEQNVVLYQTADAYYDAYEVMTYCRKEQYEKVNKNS